MFYSQFILAKKGPLGTIWIAAHLERKLRKNQVTETNIGVSVDSILFPEVPIALRLSGHLLLGVVRIYSRKVNYLFHDCSEALVKIKQAFHSGAVDLPPEAATAPFHSITLPESFDLDELELLPDREAVVLANSSVDHHVTTREQITLQEPVDDDLYLGNDFGLDERFPEVDAPRFDFEEDVFYLKSQDVQRQEGQEEHEALEEDTLPPQSLDVDETQAPGLIDLNQLNASPSNQPELHQVVATNMLDINVIPEPPEEEAELDGVRPPPKDTIATEEQLPSTTEAPMDAAEEDTHAVSAEVQASVAGSVLKAGDSIATEDLAIPAEAATSPEAAETATAILTTADAELNTEQTGATSTGIFLEAETVPEVEKVRSVAEAQEVDASIGDAFTPRQEPAEENQNVSQDDVKEAEKTPTLVQDASVVLQTASPVSPRSADGPEEDDLLATILGRRASSLRVAPTPSDLPPSKRQKPGPKPGLKKRKVRVDESSVLHGDMMREQLADTTDIRRVRRRVPCTAREIWELEKESLGQQAFDQSLLPGLCESLREMYYRIYGVGEASLPLLDSEGDAEPAPKSTGRKARDKHQMDLHETNEALSLAEDAYGDLYLCKPWLEDGEYATVEIEPASTEELQPALAARSPPLSPEPQPSSELPPAVELNPGDQEMEATLVDEKVDKETLEPEVVAEAVRPADEILADQVPATPSREGPTAETEVQKESEAQNEVLEFTEEASGMPPAEEEIETLVQEDAAEPTNEKVDHLNEVVAQAAEAEKNAAEDELSRIEVPVTPEEPTEALEFLVDAKDADNDAYDEDVDDGNAASQAQDNSGWSVRTRAVCQYLRLTFESMEASSRRGGGGGGTGSGAPKLVLGRLLQGKTRREAARMFFETLVLKTKDYVNVEQAAPFDNIYISARSKLMKAEI